ncbi:MAG: hypothetical protein WB421_11025 [Terriglobales bacterium]
MNSLPQQLRYHRPTRVRPAEFTPAVLRVEDGSCTSGELQLFSLTGGLLSLPKLLDQGSRPKLMFLTQTGPVLGVAEMLPAVSWNEQPFRFVTLHENHHKRLRAAIPGSAPLPAEPSVALAAAASAAMSVDSDLAPPSLLALDCEQPWIEKYRTAVDTKPPRRIFRKIVLAAMTVTALSLGIVYALQAHLLWW